MDKKIENKFSQNFINCATVFISVNFLILMKNQVPHKYLTKPFRKYLLMSLMLNKTATIEDQMSHFYKINFPFKKFVVDINLF